MCLASSGLTSSRLNFRPKEKQVGDLEEQLQRYRRLFASSSARLPDGGRQLQAKIASLEKDVAAAKQSTDSKSSAAQQPVRQADNTLQQSQALDSDTHQQMARDVAPSRSNVEVKTMPAAHAQQTAKPDHAAALPRPPPAWLPQEAPAAHRHISEEFKQPRKSVPSREATNSGSSGAAHEMLSSQQGSARSDFSLPRSPERQNAGSRVLPDKDPQERVEMPQQQDLMHTAGRVKEAAEFATTAETQEKQQSSSPDGRPLSSAGHSRQREQASSLPELPGKQAAVLNAAMMTPFPDEENIESNQARSLRFDLSVLASRIDSPCDSVVAMCLADKRPVQCCVNGISLCIYISFTTSKQRNCRAMIYPL